MQRLVADVGIGLTMILSFSGPIYADPIQSGPQIGEKVPGPFAPLNITGPGAGTKCCQYCKNGTRPVVVVFAREITPAVVQLLKSIDRATAINRERGLASYVVFCNDAEGYGKPLQEMAQREGIQNTIVTLYKAGGPEKYRLSAAADVTVLLYHHFTVKANHAFKNGDLNEGAIAAIGADIGKMLVE